MKGWDDDGYIKQDRSDQKREFYALSAKEQKKDIIIFIGIRPIIYGNERKVVRSSGIK